MENKQNEKTLEKVKLKIAISNFQEEEKIKMKRTSKNILKIASVACLVVVAITGVTFAENIVNFIKSFFGANTSEGVDTAVNNGYVAKVETGVQKADGIEIRVESFIMDDFNFAMNFNFSLDEKYDIDEFISTEIEDLKIIDETGAIVFNTHIPEFETEGMKGKTYMGGYSFLANKNSDRNLTISLSATGNPELFPRSKHLTITFTKITTKNSQYQGNWEFEIDVPEEFYNREVKTYRAINCNTEGIDIDQISATLSNTAFRISIPVITTDKVDYELIHTGKNISDKIALQKEYVETSDGKKFETAQRSDGDGGYSLSAEEHKIIDYHQTFNLTNYDATDIVTVHILTNKGEEIIIEFERA